MIKRMNVYFFGEEHIHPMDAAVFYGTPIATAIMLGTCWGAMLLWQ